MSGNTEMREVVDRDIALGIREPLIGLLRACVDCKRGLEQARDAQGNKQSRDVHAADIARTMARIDDLLDQYNAAGFLEGISAQPRRAS